MTPEGFSVYGLNHKTNNNAESLNRRLKSNMGDRHRGFWQFMKLLNHAFDKNSMKVGESLPLPTSTSTESPQCVVCTVNERNALINQFGCFRYCYCYPVEGGVIDNDYRGEISVLLKNNNDREFIIKTDLAITQLVFLQCFSPQLFIVVPEEELTSTERGNGAFGSTDFMQRI
ncbi:deoxyuridine 5'-triphosphate nucleotidohydrolase [Hydra vulgaris]|uniref:deoxyuridine 5'-triphosphate nucleotidohydrolase n=1 Tax=Hydra vulgaris TaxID=6087 RepID=UPI001F5EC02A|nr:deoxyuridine 5'-triphosphate nucleotidohydrolase-like [Hydra vulgaris]